MPEIHYKFKSSLSFETIKISESSITVGILKDLINQKQSIKTSGFDLKLKDSQGKVYTDDDEKIDLNSKIIVSRVPKISKPVSNIKKKEPVIINNTPEITSNLTELPINQSAVEKTNIISDVNKETTKIDPVPIATVLLEAEKSEQPIPDFLKCSLCACLMKDSMQIKCCKKNYCHECITGYLFDPDISGSLECPDCKSIVSNKDVNLTDNLGIRSMIHDFRLGKLVLVSTPVADIIDSLMPVDDELLPELEIEHEVEIAMSGSADEQDEPEPIEQKSSIVDQSIDMSHSDRADEASILVSPKSNLDDVSGPIWQEPAVPMDTTMENEEANTISVVTQPEIELVSPIEQHYHGHHNYAASTPIIPDSQPIANRTEISVINPSHVPEIMPTSTSTVSSGPKEIVNLVQHSTSIDQLGFDPVMYMKFLKIVGETCPEELRQILSTGNDSLHTSGPKEVTRRHAGGSKRPPKEDEHPSQDKSSSKRSRYDAEREEPGPGHRKCLYGPGQTADKHAEAALRYYETSAGSDKKTARPLRSRSKDHYPKKSDSYQTGIPPSSSSRRSRDYEARDREYYPSGGPRYRQTDSGQGNGGGSDDRHKYRPNYGSSVHRMKSSSKYKRSLDR